MLEPTKYLEEAEAKLLEARSLSGASHLAKVAEAQAWATLGGALAHQYPAASLETINLEGPISYEHPGIFIPGEFSPEKVEAIEAVAEFAKMESETFVIVYDVASIGAPGSVARAAHLLGIDPERLAAFVGAEAEDGAGSFGVLPGEEEAMLQGALDEASDTDPEGHEVDFFAEARADKPKKKGKK